MRISKHFQRIVQGCGYLEHVGSHPGNKSLFVFSILTSLVCYHGGSFIPMISVFLIFMVYLYGAWSRSKINEEMDFLTKSIKTEEELIEQVKIDCLSLKKKLEAKALELQKQMDDLK